MPQLLHSDGRRDTFCIVPRPRPELARQATRRMQVRDFMVRETGLKASLSHMADSQTSLCTLSSPECKQTSVIFRLLFLTASTEYSKKYE